MENIVILLMPYPPFSAKTMERRSLCCISVSSSSVFSGGMGPLPSKTFHSSWLHSLSPPMSQAARVASGDILGFVCCQPAQTLPFGKITTILSNL